jgi:hypothetical protein
MYAIKTTGLGLIAISILAAGGGNLHAGSTVYSWNGSAGGDLSIVDLNQTGNPTFQPVPPSPVVVQIAYDPSQFQDLGPVTSGDTTTFQYPNTFTLSISGTPGFTQTVAVSMVITAPPPGGGLDSIEFDAQSFVQTSGYGGAVILAPNGTLASSTQLPGNLDAFEKYALTHDGGSYNFTVPSGPDYPEYTGQVFGTLSAVPEPSSIALLAIGATLCSCFVAMRRYPPGRHHGASGSCPQES